MKPNETMIEHQNNTKHELAAISDEAMFSAFKSLMGQQMRGEVMLRERTNAEIAGWADFYLKKLVP